MAEDGGEKIDNSFCTVPPVTDHERELGNQAQHEFDKGNYETCLSTLNKVVSSRSSDAKVHHNKFLTEYCKSGFKNTDEFQKGLHIVCEMVSELLSWQNFNSEVMYELSIIYSTLGSLSGMSQEMEPCPLSSFHI